MISIQASDQFLKRRSKELIKNQSKASEAEKWNMSRLAKKLKDFSAANSVTLFTENDELYPTSKFFQDNKTEVFEIEAAGTKYEMFESMRIYIERNGRPYNYLKTVLELNNEREKYLVEEEATAKQEVAKKEVEKSKEEQVQKDALEKLFEQRLKHVKLHM